MCVLVFGGYSLFGGALFLSAGGNHSLCLVWLTDLPLW